MGLRRSVLLAPLLSLWAGAAAAADEQPICPDAPGKASQACTVPPGRFQTESNLADWTLQKGRGERDTELLIGDTNVKYGLADGWDFGVEIIPLAHVTSRVDGEHDSATGFGDVGFAVKHRLTKEGAPLQLALFPFVKIPTAKRPIGNRKWEGGLVVPIVYSIGKSPLSISYSPELDRNADADRGGHHWTMVQVASLGWQVTDKMSVSGEIWTQWDWDPSGTTRQATFDPSIAYLLNNDTQLHLGADFGLNHNSADVEISGGISHRF